MCRFCILELRIGQCEQLARQEVVLGQVLGPENRSTGAELPGLAAIQNQTYSGEEREEYLSLVAALLLEQGRFVDSFDTLQSLRNDFPLAQSQMGLAFYNLGKVYYDKSDLVRAEENFVCAYQCLENSSSIFQTLKILGFLIRISSEKLEDDKARAYIDEAKRLVEALTTSMASLNAEYFYNLGVVNTYKGDFKAAYSNYELAYRKSREEGQSELSSKTLLALAVNAFHCREFENCLKFIDQVIDLLKVVEKGHVLGMAYFYQAKALAELKHYDRALSRYRLANRALQEKKCWNLFGHILLDQGIVYKRSERYEKALDLFQLARDAVDETTFRRLSGLLDDEVKEVTDNTVDIYLDRVNCKVKERVLGTIDFKHRFILLEILFLLARNPGHYYDKDELVKKIWQGEYNPLIHDKLIYTSVSRLRKLIEPKSGRGEKCKYIIRGKDGYAFNPRVKIRFYMEPHNNRGRPVGNVDLGSPV